MLQSTTLDHRTMIIRADMENDMQDLLGFLKQTEEKKKETLLNSFLDFANDHYVTDPSFTFNREQLYERENIR